MKNLFLLMILVLTTSCTGGKKVLCEVGKTAATVVAAGISTELGCTNLEAIKTVVEEKIMATKLCEAPAEAKSLALSPVGALICAPLIDSIFAGGLAQLPKDWNCTGSASIDQIKAKLIESCIKAI